MTYLILLAALSLAVLLLLRWRRHVLRGNFDRYVNMDVSVLLAKEPVGKRRAYGSLILELKAYDPDLRSIYVSELQSKNKDIRIKYFNGLLFEVNTPGKNNVNLLSVGVQLPLCDERAYKQNVDRIYVRGRLHLADQREFSFGKNLSIRAVR